MDIQDRRSFAEIYDINPDLFEDVDILTIELPTRIINRLKTLGVNTLGGFLRYSPYTVTRVPGI